MLICLHYVTESSFALVMRTLFFGLDQNKDADQLCSNCTADQCLCFGYTDSTIPLLCKSEISSFKPSSVTLQVDL